MNKEHSGSVLDIRCASCGSPAKFYITKQIYRCRYCGAATGSYSPKARFLPDARSAF